MNIILSAEQENFIQLQLQKGKYANVEQIINQALKLLEQQEQNYENWVKETREKAEIGLRQLEKGQKVDGEIVITQLQEKLNRLRQEK